MKPDSLFDTFDRQGCLRLPGVTVRFADIPWTSHPSFAGVQLKTILPGERTDGRFSYHLVRIAPNRRIGLHAHPAQLETHEVIAGSGLCLSGGAPLSYAPGVICVFPAGHPHEIAAGPDGLCLFAKFTPASK